MMAKARDRLANIPNISFEQCGIGAKTEIAYYSDANCTSGGEISESGDEKVRIRCLNEYVDEHITMLSFDIEGYEMKALKGADKLICKQKPVIAISVYHKPNDLFELSNYILSLRNDYKIYCRHYSDVYADTVFYFI